MAGYWGKSMSNNAVEAYARGEKPKSKWSKKVLVEALREKIEQGVPAKITLSAIQKFTLPQLRILFLQYSGWHHTYVKYYPTDFFRVRDDRLNCTEEELRQILETEISRAEK